MLNYTENIVVIIRAANERTEDMCKKLILEQRISEEMVHLIREVPFSAALRKSYQIGMNSGCKWTYCIDADVLLRPGSIQKMIKFAEKESENTFEIQGFVLDKFFGGPRQAGNHLYRSSLLGKALEYIPEEGVNIRPERHTLGEMAEQGYKWKSVPYIVGLHDEEQYYFDIYRKAFVHGVKHIDRLPLFVSLWKENSSADPDFEVALAALSESIKTTEQLFINSEQEIYNKMFEKSGFTEKTKIDSKEISLGTVERTIQSWKSPDLYFSYFPTRDGYDTAFSGFLNKIKRLNNKFGPAKLVKIGLKKIAQ